VPVLGVGGGVITAPFWVADPAQRWRHPAGLPKMRAVSPLLMPAVSPPAALLGAALLAAALLPPGIAAAGGPDLRGYPAPAAGERRWLIELPAQPPASPDPRLSRDAADWRGELVVGREQLVDCNVHRLAGELRPEPLPALGTSLYRVSGGTATLSTRRACPGEMPKRRFVPIGGKPFVVPYNASLPIVLYAPRDLQVRWRLWKAETRQQPAQRL